MPYYFTGYFSTKDVDHIMPCALHYGPWWHNCSPECEGKSHRWAHPGCFFMNLNGPYDVGKGVSWRLGPGTFSGTAMMVK